MSSRRNIAVAGAALLVIVGAVWWLRDAPKKPVAPAARATAQVEPVVEAKPPEPARAAPAPEPSGSSGLPPSHFEEKRRAQEEAQAALLELEEAKYAGVDFSAKRPGPPPPRAPVQGKNEEEMTPAEKAAQVERMIGLVRDRAERTQRRAEEATKQGDKDEAAKQEAILARLRQRQGELEYRRKILRGEDIPPGSAPAPAASR